MQNLNISAGILSNSRERIKSTKGYQEKVQTLKEEIGLKYQRLMICEKNTFKRLILKIKKHIEIRKAIGKLTSLDKMYFFLWLVFSPNNLYHLFP